MRTKNLLLAGLASVTMFAVSCSKEKDPTQGEQGRASMEIRITGQENGVKAISDGTENTKESAVYNATVFVFNTDGSLDQMAEITDISTPKRLDDLKAGAKKVAVVLNKTEGLSFPNGITYGWFANKDNAINLDDQTPAKMGAKGLVMTGEKDVTLIANQDNNVTVPVSRVVAKVKLGTITLDPEQGQDPSKLELTSLYLMKARAKVTLGLPTVTYDDDSFFGGKIPSPGPGLSVQRDYLLEGISYNENTDVSAYNDRFFYIFPTDDATNNTTLLVLEGTYDSKPVTYTFRVNGTNSIERNTGYVLNITLKKLATSSGGNENPSDPASILLTVEPQPWENDIIQNVTW